MGAGNKGPKPLHLVVGVLVVGGFAVGGLAVGGLAVGGLGLRGVAGLRPQQPPPWLVAPLLPLRGWRVAASASGGRKRS